MFYRAVVIGASAGGFQALKNVLPSLPADFPLPVIIVQHIGAHSDGFMAEYLNQLSAITVKEAEDKEPFKPGVAYFAPPGYHLLIEPEEIFSLSVDPRVNYSCPSIDVLFESAAEALGDALIGIVLTGANADGAHGLKTIKNYGGLAIVQDPQTAESPIMPKAALGMVCADYVMPLEKIAAFLTQLVAHKKEASSAAS